MVASHSPRVSRPIMIGPKPSKSNGAREQTSSYDYSDCAVHRDPQLTLGQEELVIQNTQARTVEKPTL